MIDDMITNIIYILSAVSFLQPNAQRFFAAIVFSVITLSHDFFMSQYDGFLYYGSAALFDLFIIIITSGINPVPKMVIHLHIICMISILLNLMGWALWFFYYPPLIYNSLFIVIYLWSLVVLLRRDKDDVGGYTMDSILSCFRFNRGTWTMYLYKYLRKI